MTENVSWSGAEMGVHSFLGSILLALYTWRMVSLAHPSQDWPLLSLFPFTLCRYGCSGWTNLHISSPLPHGDSFYFDREIKVVSQGVSLVHPILMCMFSFWIHSSLLICMWLAIEISIAWYIVVRSCCEMFIGVMALNAERSLLALVIMWSTWPQKHIVRSNSTP